MDAIAQRKEVREGVEDIDRKVFMVFTYEDGSEEAIYLRAARPDEH